MRSFIILLLLCILLNTYSIDQTEMLSEQMKVDALTSIQHSEKDISSDVSESEVELSSKKQSKVLFLNSLLGTNFSLQEVEAKDIEKANKKENHHHHRRHHSEEEEDDEEEKEEEEHRRRHHHHHRRQLTKDQNISITLKLPKSITAPKAGEIKKAEVKAEVKKAEVKSAEVKKVEPVVKPAVVVSTPVKYAEVKKVEPAVKPAVVVATPAPVVIATVAALAPVKPVSLELHCKAGTFFAETVKHCFPCPPGKGSLDGATTCVALALLPALPISLCGAGTFIKDGLCAPCPEGTTSGTHAKFCIPKASVKAKHVPVIHDHDVVAKKEAKVASDNAALVAAAVSAALKAVSTPKPVRRRRHRHHKKHHHKHHDTEKKRHQKKKRHHNSVVETAKKHPIATAAVGATALAGLAALMSSGSKPASPYATVSPAVLSQLKEAINNIKTGNTAKKHKKKRH